MGVRAVSVYAQLQARVRALYSYLLPLETLRSLLQTKDLEAVLGLLTKTPYAPYLERVERRLLTPRRTVYQLNRRLADVYEKLIGLTPEPGRQLLIQLSRLFEIDNLKAILRGIEHDTPWEQVLYLLAPVQDYMLITLDDLHNMLLREDITDALQVIKETPYYDPLSHALNRYRQEESLFPLEVALDLSYRRGLWERTQRLSGKDHKVAARLVGTLIDVDNLLWAIRYRGYHHLSEQEIINYTFSFGYRVRDRHIRAIASGAEIAPVVRDIYPDLERIGDFEADLGKALADLEHVLNRHIVELCAAEFRGEPFHIGLPIAYLLLLEHEVKNLMAIIEAKASGLSIAMARSVVDFLPLDNRRTDQMDER